MNEPRAKIIEVAGRLVLDDPDAYAVAMAVGKHNCKRTMLQQRERVLHFAKRIDERRLAPEDVVIVLINVDDRYGELGEHLTPGVNWQEFRDRGEVPFARGLAGRSGIQAFLDATDETSASKLRQSHGIAVLVADHRTTEVFRIADLDELSR